MENHNRIQRNSTSKKVFDLTQDEGRVGIRFAPNAFSSQQLAIEIPSFVSHHGLPTQSPPQRSQPLKARPILPPKSMLSTAPSRILPPAYVASQHLKSSRTTLSHEPTILGYPAKRRKIDHVKQSTPIVPPPPNYKKPGQHISNKKVEEDRTRSNPLPKATVISGASRAEHSQLPRISSEGLVQKPWAIGKSEQAPVAETLVKQVFPHVKRALNRAGIAEKDRVPIGTKAIEQLVLNPAFYTHFSTNHGLPETYENLLKTQAYTHVNRLKGERGKALTLTQSPSNPVTSSDSSQPTPKHWQRHLPQPSPGSDLYSSEAEDVFEENLVSVSAAHRLRGTLRHSHSSSPTTSFSHDEDAVKLESLDTLNRKPATANSGRKLRSSRIAPNEPLLPLQTHVTPDLATVKRSFESGVGKNVPRKIKSGGSKGGKEDLNSFPAEMDLAIRIQSQQITAKVTRIDRPYLTFKERENALRGTQIWAKSSSSPSKVEPLHPIALHVDFSIEEMKIMHVVIAHTCGATVLGVASVDFDLAEHIMSLMKGKRKLVFQLRKSVKHAIKVSDDDQGVALLRGRSDAALTAFLQDAADGMLSSKMKAILPELRRPSSSSFRPKPMLSQLLFQRELNGLEPHRVRVGHSSFKHIASAEAEDSFVRISEFTDCCGDISTIAWTGDQAFVCGATAHSDFHNMQYNKPGNLALGSTSLDTLRAFPEHRTRRPTVTNSENAENSLDSMRRTQSPWLYTSVVSTAHSKSSGYSYTASFDKTVKVWTVAEDGSQMCCCGTLYHDGKVNFVITSQHHDRVATASDVSHDAVRVYTIDPDDVYKSTYEMFGGNRAEAQQLEVVETWAYFPATIQWGKAKGVSHLLLVGYSPRSVTSHECDIPEDKQNTGELCLWNVDTGDPVVINSAKTQNVFEVLWHPSQPIFAAATSPSGNYEPLTTKTQIRLFAQTETGTFLNLKIFDCPAMDVNELTIMPSSRIHSYVTASCTDGKTYVYDSAKSDRPIHILRHGESLDNPLHDIPRELADTGVKFAAWGKSKNRFYTGASDGKLKAWDVTSPSPFIRDVLTLSGGISVGTFSHDLSKLVIGDATGKVHILGLDDAGESEAEQKFHNKTHPKRSLQPLQPLQMRHLLRQGGLLPSNLKRPKVLIPHPEPALGRHAINVELTAKDIANAYIEQNQITIIRDRTMGAVQGPNYHETGLYHTTAHYQLIGGMPLLPEWQARQQSELRRTPKPLHLPILPTIRTIHLPGTLKSMSFDLRIEDLNPSTLRELKLDRVEFDWEESYDLDYELEPANEVFEDSETLLKRYEQAGKAGTESMDLDT